ncbi:unnamed protein product, partial [Prorocentrum cordatum]
SAGCASGPTVPSRCRGSSAAGWAGGARAAREEELAEHEAARRLRRLAPREQAAVCIQRHHRGHSARGRLRAARARGDAEAGRLR